MSYLKKFVAGLNFFLFSLKKKTLPHTKDISCIVDAYYKHINSLTHTARPGTTNCKSYKYLFHAGIEPTTRSKAADRSATAPTVSSKLKNYHRTSNSMNI